MADMGVGGRGAGGGGVVCMDVWMGLERGGEEMVVEGGSVWISLGLEMKGMAAMRGA